MSFRRAFWKGKKPPANTYCSRRACSARFGVGSASAALIGTFDTTAKAVGWQVGRAGDIEQAETREETLAPTLFLSMLCGALARQSQVGAPQAQKPLPRVAPSLENGSLASPFGQQLIGCSSSGSPGWSAAHSRLLLPGLLLYLGFRGLHRQPIHHWRLSNSNSMAFSSILYFQWITNVPDRPHPDSERESPEISRNP